MIFKGHVLLSDLHIPALLNVFAAVFGACCANMLKILLGIIECIFSHRRIPVLPCLPTPGMWSER